MAHFAEIDENNIVTRVLVVANEQEHRGQEFLANDLGLGGFWIQTSYNNNIRKNYAGIGYTFDPVRDAFIHHNLMLHGFLTKKLADGKHLLHILQMESFTFGMKQLQIGKQS